ncbi:sialate O-acetylesterase [Haloferula luteola]|uniref:Sialate O-acetylesterase n=1 Tax=Haloferula luteola TaxID=595692 RepID=A0A840VCD4_9BACT|nr:sialate O-acetylesterase [Haloferula luteola]MBB5351580.1 sialate O-acetylesterase [Haloferula luteola]
MNRSLALLPLLAATLNAAVLDPVFSSGMVLQRDQPLRLSGSGNPGETLEVRLGEQSATTEVDEHGRWKTVLSAFPAGGPYQLTAGDSTAQDVWIGDVWLCSGQSNMQMGVREIESARECLAARPTQVRLLTLPRGGADSPRYEGPAEWVAPDATTLADFSAVAWSFGLALREDPTLAHVPIGLVNASFGGTAVEAWLASQPEVPKEQISGSMFDMAPTVLYNGMIHPITPLTVKGALWYQGESNSGHPEAYAELLQQMMRDWRRAWHQPEMPFFIIQLPAFSGRINGLDFSWLREAQAKACQQTDHAWLVVTYDTTDGFDLHPRQKREIGRRTALLARREVLGESLPSQAPQLESVHTEASQLHLTFDQPLVVSKGFHPNGFILAGKDGEFHHAKAVLHGDEVILESDAVNDPQWVRFAWGPIPEANLTNSAGIPPVPFRTDSLPPDSMVFQPLPTSYQLETPRYRLETGALGAVTSFQVQGKPFIASGPGGGTWIPTPFGPRNLSSTIVDGPRRLILSESTISLTLTGDAATSLWIVANDGNDPIDFHIALDPAVSVDLKGTTAKLTRDGTSVTIEGISQRDGESTLIVKVPGHARQEIRWIP